jgi:hypothetical protein
VKPSLATSTSNANELPKGPRAMIARRRLENVAPTFSDRRSHPPGRYRQFQIHQLRILSQLRQDHQVAFRISNYPNYKSHRLTFSLSKSPSIPPYLSGLAYNRRAHLSSARKPRRRCREWNRNREDRKLSVLLDMGTLTGLCINAQPTTWL